MNLLKTILWGLFYLIAMYVLRPLDVAIVTAIKGFPYTYWEHVTDIAKARWDETGSDCEPLKDYVKQCWEDV